MGLILRDVAVLDPALEVSPAGPERRDLVVGDDGRIAGFHPPGQAGPGRSLDTSGLTVLPGLVDSHVHLCFDPDRAPEEWMPDVTDRDLLDLAAEHARQTLRAGVTTVRDLGSRGSVVADLATGIRAGRIVGPRVLLSGPAVTIPAGHCFYVGDVVSDRAGLARVVDGHLAAGHDWLKIMVTGGALTSTSDPGTLQFGAVEVAEAVARAARGGLPVAAHVLTAEGGAIAVAAGARTIEHGIGLRPADLDAMRRAGQYLVPVLTPSHRLLRSDPDGTGQHVSRLRSLVTSLRATTAAAIERSVTVLAGTDAGCPRVPHGCLAGEIGLLGELGLPTPEALAAATTWPARALGLTGVAGLTVGSVADLLLVEGDPLADPGVLAAPAAVLAGGRLVTGNRLMAEPPSHRPTPVDRR